MERPRLDRRARRGAHSPRIGRGRYRACAGHLRRRRRPHRLVPVAAAALARDRRGRHLRQALLDARRRAGLRAAARRERRARRRDGEATSVYGLDPETGAVLWSRDLGQPWNPVEVALRRPHAVDRHHRHAGDRPRDEHRSTSPRRPTSRGAAAYLLHALDLHTGAERPGFPVTIAGHGSEPAGRRVRPEAWSSSARPAPARRRRLRGLRRACATGRRSRAGSSASPPPGAITTRFVTRTPADSGASIWQSGGGLVSDGPGQILFTTGNGGTAPAGSAGDDPPADLGQAVVRHDGAARRLAQGRPTSSRPTTRSSSTTWDADLGSAAPVALPPQFGTPSHPHLLVAVRQAGLRLPARPRRARRLGAGRRRR